MYEYFPFLTSHSRLKWHAIIQRVPIFYIKSSCINFYGKYNYHRFQHRFYEWHWWIFWCEKSRKLQNCNFQKFPIGYFVSNIYIKYQIVVLHIIYYIVLIVLECWMLILLHHFYIFIDGSSTSHWYKMWLWSVILPLICSIHMYVSCVNQPRKNGKYWLILKRAIGEDWIFCHFTNTSFAYSHEAV